jgi:HPt (histidine-containing phosphotransfer) domain-containing protein
MSEPNKYDKLYDLTSIYAISDDNPEFLNKLLQVFSANIAKDVEDIKAAAGKNNWADVGQLAHKLKPSAAHFGITSLKEILKKLERQEGQDIVTLNSLVLQLDAIVAKVISGLKAEFPATFAQ